MEVRQNYSNLAALASRKKPSFWSLGCEALPHSPTFFNVDADLPGHLLAHIIIFELVEKGFKTQNFETKKCYKLLKIVFYLTANRIFKY